MKTLATQLQADPTPVRKALSIIVADDLEEIVRLVRTCLEAVGHEVTEVTSGSEVIRLSASNTLISSSPMC